MIRDQKKYTVYLKIEMPEVVASTPELAIQWLESEIRDYFDSLGIADGLRFWQKEAQEEESATDAER